MSKWQRLAMAFPIVMGLVEQAEDLKTYAGDRKSAEYDSMIAGFVDTVVTAIETAVGRDLIDNTKLRAAVLAALDVPPLS